MTPLFVKCKDTNEKIEKSKAFCVEYFINYKGKPQKRRDYWSSEEAYNKHCIESEYRKKCTDLMFEILQYDPQVDIVHGLFNKMLNDYKNIGLDIVYKTMVGQREYMEYALETCVFSNEFHKMRYLMKIVENHIMEYKNPENYQTMENRIEQIRTQGSNIPAGMCESDFYID